MLRGKITYRLLASLLAALSVCTTLSAQSTRVRGRVTDAASGAPMQFVSVVFPGTTTGITTDEEGIYTLETRDTVGAYRPRWSATPRRPSRSRGAASTR